ncbi:MAG: hypothetical protein DHS20C19_02160 [Acidimicrobiales bacterium]|nr:MAG: hypothetical protein DHS20C19_02160 [Acidimicrobiales bacterium]
MTPPKPTRRSVSLGPKEEVHIAAAAEADGVSTNEAIRRAIQVDAAIRTLVEQGATVVVEDRNGVLQKVVFAHLGVGAAPVVDVEAEDRESRSEEVERVHDEVRTRLNTGQRSSKAPIKSRSKSKSRKTGASSQRDSGLPRSSGTHDQASKRSP